MRNIIFIIALFLISCVPNVEIIKPEMISTNIIVKDISGKILNEYTTIFINNYSNKIPAWEFINPQGIEFEKNRNMTIRFNIYDIIDEKRYEGQEINYIGGSGNIIIIMKEI